MKFNSLNYVLLYLPIVVIIYFQLNKYVKKQIYLNLWICIASYFFYGSYGLIYMIPLIASSLVDYYGANFIYRLDNPKMKKAIFISCMTFDLGLLCFFKYSKWLIEIINNVLSHFGITEISPPAYSMILPPGISFYTFQTMCYVIDVYQKKYAPKKEMVNYLTYVTFWPQLVAGPIMRANNLLTPLSQRRPNVTSTVIVNSILLIAWGLFKKIVLADNFGHLVDYVDDLTKKGQLYPGAGYIFAYGFAGQIYCDFSAYCDIAIGSARLIGIELTRNFMTPYFSKSASEFWRRWHITLSNWLRDYVYIPLGGNRVGKVKEYRNLFVTMFFVGLWHGAGFLFIAWGLFHAALLVLYRIIPIDKYFSRIFGKFGDVFSIFIMFNLTCFGWILFRADMNTIIPILQTMVDITPFINSIMNLTIDPSLWLTGILGKGLLSLWVVLFITEFIAFYYKCEFGDVIEKMPGLLKAIMLVLIYFGIILLGKREGVEFVYFQF